MGIFLEGEDFCGDHGLGRLVEFRFKAPPGTTSSSITTHTPCGQRNCASWASQPQKSVTILPCPGGRTTKSTNNMWWHWRKKIFLLQPRCYRGLGGQHHAPTALPWRKNSFTHCTGGYAGLETSLDGCGTFALTVVGTQNRPARSHHGYQMT